MFSSVLRNTHKLCHVHVVKINHGISIEFHHIDHIIASQILITLLLHKFYLQWVINIWTITVHMFFIKADVVIRPDEDYIIFSPLKFTYMYMLEKQEKKSCEWFFLILFFWGGG